MAMTGFGTETEDAAETIALCLSGGGLRATLFHFGLIKALATHRKRDCPAIASVRDVYSVSGGSIAAAHLVVNWADYNDPDRFAALEQQMRAFARRNVRDRVLRRWLLTRGLPAAAERLAWLIPLLSRLTDWMEGRGMGTRRTHWLRRQYEGLLGTGSIADCYRTRVSTAGLPPALHVLATSFTSGDLCSFSRERFEVEANVASRKRAMGDGDRTTPAPIEHEADGGQISLAFAVTASSAFPPLFPPVRLDARMLRNPEDPYFDQDILLSDGGVFDNIGFEKFALAHARDPDPVTTLLVSNAGGSFRTSGNDTYSSIISRNIRASDILMRRVGDNTAGAARTLAALTRATGLALIDVQIGDSDHDDILLPATQKSLRLVRTDLDAFGDPLAGLLIDHGYRIGSKQLRAAGWQPSDLPAWCIAGGSDEALAQHAERGAERTIWRSLFFDFGDLAWLFAMWIILIGVVVSAGYSVVRAREAARSEAELKDAKAKAGIDRLRAIEQDSKRKADLLYSVKRALASGNVAEAQRILNTNLELAERQADQAAADVARSVRGSVKDGTDTVETKSATAASANGRIDVLPAAPVAYRQQIYIQFAGTLTRAQITALNQNLRAAGWQTQGQSGERIAPAKNTNQVRYSGNNAAAAKDLADAINATRMFDEKVEPLVWKRIGSNVLEVWLSTD